MADPPRAAPGSKHLPWDTFRIPPDAARPPGAGGWDGEFASARGVVGGIGPGNGTSATAGSPIACDWCADGRRRSGNGNGGRRPRSDGGTPRRSGHGGSGIPGRVSHPPAMILRRSGRKPARGHAAKPLFHRSSATGRGVTSRRVPRVERRQGTVAIRVAMPCGGSGTANASICIARRSKAGGNAAWSMRPQRRGCTRCRRQAAVARPTPSASPKAGQKSRSATIGGTTGRA